MREKEKSDKLNSTVDDDEYFKLLKNKGYEIFVPSIDSEEEEVLEGLDILIKKFLGPKVLGIDINVKIYFIDNAMINAAVCKRGNTYYISLFRGIITELRSFVLNFVMENFPYDFFEEQFEMSYVNQGSIFAFFKKDDCEHYKLANNIANNILFLIVYHEMGHIFSGHQEKITNDDEFWMEASQDKEGNILTQAKELMADFFSMINALGIYDYNHHERMEEYMLNHCCYLISLYSLYIYFEKNNGNTFGTYEELFERSHPHPAIRLLYMMDFLDEETEHGLKKIYKVNWLTEDNEMDILNIIKGLSYYGICKFSMKLPEEFRLVNKLYEDRSLRIRQLVQNIASDLYEETYRKVAIVKLKEIGRVADGYVDDVLKSNEEFGKYDAIEMDV